MAEPTQPEWRAKLIAAAQADRALRAKLSAEGALSDGYNAEMEALHLANADVLEQTIDAIGWPGRAKVGDDGAGAAFLIVQHAISRPALQRAALALVIDAIDDGQANPLDAAYLSDRIATYEGRGQIFGTQFDWDENGLLSPLPLADPINVEERRAEIGMPPLSDAIADMRAMAAANGETRPADYAARKAKFDAWAKRVGWRS